MIQTIAISVLSLIAAAYLARLVYRSFTSNSCESGCGHCGVADVNAMVESFEKKQAQG